MTQQPTEDVALEFVETSTTADRCCARQQRLSRSDLDLVRTKRSDANRLGFAVLLLHFRKHGQFPRTDSQLERGLAPDVMAQLGIATASLGTIELTDRTAERHRAEIRTLLGFREATVADGEALTEWLRDHAVSDSRDIAELTSALEQQCWALKIEPPVADRIERIVRAALRAHDERFCNEIHSRLLPATASDTNSARCLAQPCYNKSEACDERRS